MTLRYLCGMVAIACLAGAVEAAEYQFDWTPASGGAVSNKGGEIQQIKSTYNTATNVLGWEATFGGVPDRPDLHTDGFWLALSPGPNPKGYAGELAIFYFDASSGTPKLTAYGYNGRNDQSSYYDGTSNNAIDTPDRILSSINDPSFVLDIGAVDNGNGTRTLKFKVNATAIQNHNPAYPEVSPWTGASFGSQVGVWFHPTAGTGASYVNGFLNSFTDQKQGYMDGENFTTTLVPEPATLFALSLGAAALMRRRRKS